MGTPCGFDLAPVNAADQEPMTVEEAVRLGEEFGVIVGDVDEDIRKELKLERAQGVAVFEVIGSSRLIALPKSIMFLISVLSISLMMDRTLMPA